MYNRNSTHTSNQSDTDSK